MKIEFISRKYNPNDWEPRDCFFILIDGERYMSFCDGEVEDNNLGRNFNSVFHIPDLVMKVIAEIQADKTIEIIQEELDDKQLEERGIW